MQVTLPNGVEIEGEVEYMEHSCLLCDEPAIRLRFPRYMESPEYLDEQWCLVHVMMLWKAAERYNVEKQLTLEGMHRPFRPWRRSTWWRVKLVPVHARWALKRVPVYFKLLRIRLELLWIRVWHE